MPELPEVETIRLGLEYKILNKKIIKIEIKKNNLVKNSLIIFKKNLIDQKFTNLDRIGKLLIFTIANSNKFLLIHLKMTGQLIYCDKKNFVAGGHANSQAERKNFELGKREEFCQPGKYTHLIFTFADNSYLFFNDLRQFGYLKIVSASELAEIKTNYGIEPGQKNFTWKNFQKIFIGRKSNIKTLLLNQKIIAGLGNIYVDEILFRSKILPTRSANTLTEIEKKDIFSFTKKIIKWAIRAGGTTFSDYRDSAGRRGNYWAEINVYNRAGKICPSCQKNKIKKIKLNGRGTHFCDFCQK